MQANNPRRPHFVPRQAPAKTDKAKQPRQLVTSLALLAVLSLLFSVWLGFVIGLGVQVFRLVTGL